MAKKEKPNSNGKTERDNKGRFVKGNHAAACRSDGEMIHRARVLKQALIDAVTEKDIRDITKKLIGQAKKGNVKAIKELYDRIFGKAPQAVEVKGEGQKITFQVVMPGKSNGPAHPQINGTPRISMERVEPSRN